MAEFTFTAVMIHLRSGAHLRSSLAVSPTSLSRHLEKTKAHADQRLKTNGSLPSAGQFARELRRFSRLEEERLRVADRLGAGGRWSVGVRSFIVDLVVQFAVQHACWAEGARRETGAAIVAIGGYGRAELAPFSDLDILFVTGGKASAEPATVIERCLHLLWDAGFSIGQKQFSMTDCVPASRTDPHFQTALVNARFVAGDGELYERLTEALKREREKNAKLLVATVRQEREQLFQKRGAAICLQQPNVKENAGGLRDLHCALWAVYADAGHKTLEGLLAHELIEADQYERAVTAYDFLLRVRQQAHWISGRKTDRLSLELQDTIARKLGYSASAHLQPSEKFMRDYYRHAREIHQLSESLFGRATDRFRRPRRWHTPRRERLDERFSIQDGKISLDEDTQQLAADPLMFFKAAALAQSRKADFSSQLSEAIRNHLQGIDADFRKSRQASHLFLELLRGGGRVGHALRLMHETGLLGRYLPEFQRITMLIHHDLYHHYTVDEHTLRAIEALDELHADDDSTRRSLRAALAEVEDVTLLYLALVLHDLGKAGGGGHIPRGAHLAERICDRLGLNAESKAKVVRLVRHHVLMAHVSQRRDLREPRVAKHFAAQVGSLDVLNMLFVMTYADLNGVGPGVWSDWKGTLLEELYRRTRAVFSGEPLTVRDDVQLVKQKVVEQLSDVISISEIERHFALSPARSLESIEAEDVGRHLRLVQQLENESVACHWQDKGNFATELTISARDRHGLFADIAGTLAASGIEILSAEVNTREDGIAIDSFVLRQATTHRSVDSHRWEMIVRTLRASVEGAHDVAALVERWRARHAPRRTTTMATHRTGRLSITCDNEAAEATTLVEVRAPDEHGLAYKIARILTACGLEIVCAKIATEKSDALDAFYVTMGDGVKVNQATMRELESVLIDGLSKKESLRDAIAQ